MRRTPIGEDSIENVSKLTDDNIDKAFFLKEELAEKIKKIKQY